MANATHHFSFNIFEIQITRDYSDPTGIQEKDNLDAQVHQNINPDGSDANSSPDHEIVKRFFVHSSLCESTSVFFKSKARFASNTGVAADVITVTFPESEEPFLLAYLKWLYGTYLNSNDRDFLLQCYIFADEYQIAKFGQCVLRALGRTLMKEDVPWFPTLEQIKYIYDNTVGSNPVGRFMAYCMTWCSPGDMDEFLEEAPCGFVRDYASICLFRLHEVGMKNFDHHNHLKNYLISQTKRFGADETTFKNTRLFFHVNDFHNMVSFTLANTPKPAMVHLAVLARLMDTENTLKLPTLNFSFPHIHIQSFTIFLAWLYSKENLTAPEHIFQADDGFQSLLDCYKTADFLTRFAAEPEDGGSTYKAPSQKACEDQTQDEVLKSTDRKELREAEETGDQNINNNPESDYSKKLLYLLKYRGAQFKDAIIEAMVFKVKQKRTLPTPAEVEYAYSITDNCQDSLRRLLVSLYVWNSHSVENMIPEFKRDYINESAKRKPAAFKESKQRIAKLSHSAPPYEDSQNFQDAHHYHSEYKESVANINTLSLGIPNRTFAPLRTTKLDQSDQDPASPTSN